MKRFLFYMWCYIFNYYSWLEKKYSSVDCPKCGKVLGLFIKIRRNKWFWECSCGYKTVDSLFRMLNKLKIR